MRMTINRAIGTTSLVAAGTVPNGDITFRQELAIAGTVNGSVTCSGVDSGVIRILDGGSFTGEINAPTGTSLQGRRNRDRHEQYPSGHRPSRCDSILQAGNQLGSRDYG